MQTCLPAQDERREEKLLLREVSQQSRRAGTTRSEGQPHRRGRKRAFQESEQANLPEEAAQDNEVRRKFKQFSGEKSRRFSKSFKPFFNAFLPLKSQGDFSRIDIGNQDDAEERVNTHKSTNVTESSVSEKAVVRDTEDDAVSDYSLKQPAVSTAIPGTSKPCLEEIFRSVFMTLFPKKKIQRG